MGTPFVTDGQLKRAIQGIEDKIPCFSALKKISDYLYEVDYDKLDYTYANEYFKSHDAAMIPFACSSIRSGGFFGRNFDWFYNHDCDFIIRTSSIGKIPSIGVAGSVPSLTKSIMEHGPSSNSMKILPFYTLDGINQAGVFINSNVVPQDKGKVTHTVCTENKEHDMFMIMWPRFVLDNFTTAISAIEYAQKHISFFQIDMAAKFGYDIHFMIGDTEHTYVVEFINNKLEYIECDKMTNFHVIGTEFNGNGKVYTPSTQDATHNAMDTNKVTAHGSGLERWNILVNNIATANTKEGMVDLMKNKINYNNSYINTGVNSWYSEFVGVYPSGNYTVKTEPSKFEETVMPTVRERFANRNRNNNPQTIWHTTHTSIYDISNKVLYLYDSTEDGAEHAFYLDSKLITSGAGLHSIQTSSSQCFASGDFASATGYGTQAEANYSHTEGFITKVSSDDEHDARYGHSEGYMTYVGGLASHAEGDTTYTQNIGEHAEGRGNKSHKDSDAFGSAGNTIHSIGIAQNNQDITTFKNAVEVMQNGDVYIIGIGGYDGTNIEEAQSVQQVIAGLTNK